jgi:hypothetical protein
MPEVAEQAVTHRRLPAMQRPRVRHVDRAVEVVAEAAVAPAMHIERRAVARLHDKRDQRTRATEAEQQRDEPRDASMRARKRLGERLWHRCRVAVRRAAVLARRACRGAGRRVLCRASA